MNSPEIYPPGSVILAPIAGYSDLPMRMSARRAGCRYAFTEMIDAGSLVHNTQKTRSLAQRGELEPFLGIQLVGSEIETLRNAVRIINSLPFDVLDFNLGCPAPKVARKGEGITLALNNPDMALRCLDAITAESRIPVTVKTRIQSEEDVAPTLAFCRRLADAGAKTITLHGRVMKRFYGGPVFTDQIRAVRIGLPVPVVANGGALTEEAARTLFSETGCESIMVARGAIGNPWIFRELSGGKPPTLEEFTAELDRHVSEMLERYGDNLGFRIARKTVLAYLRGRGFSGALRASVSFLSTRDDWHSLLCQLEEGPSPRYREMLLSGSAGSIERRLSF